MGTQAGEIARDPLASIHFEEGSPKDLTRYRSRAIWFVFCAPDVLLPVRQRKISSHLRLSGGFARNFGKNSGRETRLRIVTTGSMSEHFRGFGMGCHDLGWKMLDRGARERLDSRFKAVCLRATLSIPVICHESCGGVAHDSRSDLTRRTIILEPSPSWSGYCRLA